MPEMAAAMTDTAEHGNNNQPVVPDEPASRIAVLIDTENISSRSLPWLIEQIALVGKPVIWRCYGDFQLSQLRPWSLAAPLHGIEIRHQQATGRRKNVSDIHLAIEAMDLLHDSEIDIFCIVTNDKDFTPLVMRMRQQGVRVHGFGGPGAASALQSACSTFKNIEGLVEPTRPKPARRKTLRALEEAPPLFTRVLKALPDSQGWIPFDHFETQLLQDDPYFESRRFGYPSLLQLLKALRQFRVHQIPQGGTWVGMRRKVKGKPPGATCSAGKTNKKESDEPFSAGDESKA